MSLNFAITGDNTDLKKKLYESKQAIADTGNSVKSQSDSIMNSVKTIAAGVGIGFGIAQAKNLVGEIINVRGEFQKYEAVLTNTFQSNNRAAESMGMITEFASKTPFQLNELTDSYVKLVNQGFTPTKNEMRQLGDLASSTGKGFNQLTEAILDAQTGQFERLKEFGIKAAQNGDKVTMSFKGQKTTIDNTSDSIKDYLLSLGDMTGVEGSMEAISKTLVGQVSNLEDSVSQMINNIGQESEGMLAAGIGGVSFLVENYETVGKVIAGLVAVYGTYKAAVILVSIAEQIRYQASLAQMAGMTTMQAITDVLKAKTAALNATMLMNPYVLIAMAVVALVAVMWTMHDSTTTEEKAQRELNDAIAEHKDKLEKDKQESQKYLGIINDTTLSLNTQTKAWQELQKVSGAFKGMSLAEIQQLTPAEQAKIIDDYNAKSEKNNEVSLRDQSQAKLEKLKKQEQDIIAAPANQGTAAALSAINKQIDLEQEKLTQINKTIQEREKAEALAAMTSQQRIDYYDKLIQKNKENRAKALLDNPDVDTSKVDEKIKEWEQLKDSEGRAIESASVQNKAFWENAKKEAESKLDGMAISEKGSKAWNEAVKKKNEAETKLKAWSFDSKSTDDFAKAVKDAFQKATDAATALERKRITDKKALLDFDLANTIKNIEKERAEYKKKYGSNVDTSSFDKRIATAKLEVEFDKNKIDEEFAKYVKELNDANLSIQFDIDVAKLKNELDITTDVTRQLELQKQIRDKMAQKAIEAIDKEEEAAVKKAKDEGQSEEQIGVIKDAYKKKRELTTDKLSVDNNQEDLVKKISTYKDYAQRLIDIEKWKEDKIKAINENESLSDEAKKSQTDTVTQKADFDISQAGQELGVEAANISGTLSEIVKSTMDQSIDTLMNQIPILQSELDNLKKSGADADKIAAAEAKLAVANSALTEKSNELGDVTETTGDKMSTSYKKASKSLKLVVDACDLISDSFGDLLSETGKDALNTAKTVATSTISLIQLISTTAWTGANAISGIEKASVILTIISMAVQVIMAIVDVMMKYFSKNAEIQAQIDSSKSRVDSLKDSYDNLERSIANSIGSDYYQGQIELAKNLNLQIQEYNRQVQLAQEQLANASTDKKKEDAQSQLDEITSSQQDALDAQRDALNEFYNGLITTDLASFADELASSIVDGFSNGLTDMSTVFDTAFDDLMKQMITKQISMNLTKSLEKTFDTLKSAFGDGDTSLSQAEIERIKAQYEIDKQAAEGQAEAYRQLMEEMGLTDDPEQQAQSKGFAAMSQDTGDELNGRFTAIQISTANIDVNVADLKRINFDLLGYAREINAYINMLSLIGESQLLELRMIAGNTAVLKETNLRLKKIEENTSRL